MATVDRRVGMNHPLMASRADLIEVIVAPSRMAWVVVAKVINEGGRMMIHLSDVVEIPSGAKGLDIREDLRADAIDIFVAAVGAIGRIAVVVGSIKVFVMFVG